MENEVPANLIFSDSHLKISYGENERLNRTKNAIVIEGTRGGFLSLSNTITFLSNSLQEEICLSLLSYISSDIIFTIKCDESTNEIIYGKVTKNNDDYVWKLSESEICRVASDIHSLGHINSELHFDEGKDFNEISIYCVIG